MKMLAKGRVFWAALIGILFFAVGCGRKDDEALPNYVVKEVQTGTTAENTQGVTELPEDKSVGLTGNSSIVREEVTDNAADKDGEDAAAQGGEKLPDGGANKGTKPGTEGVGAKQEPDSAADENPGQKDDAPAQDMDSAADGKDGLGADSKDDGNPSEDTVKGERVNVMSVDELSLLPSGTTVEIGMLSEAELEACFYFEEVSDAVFARMEGNSYGGDCTVALSELRYVRVLHYGFDGAAHIGELVVNRAIAQDTRDIFKELFDAQYPIEKMLLIDTYGGDDDASMSDNNTSSFNFRTVEGTTTLSKHAYGLAIDINPLYNPYIPIRNNVPVVLPASAQAYADREAECEYYIRRGDVCYEAFVSRGFTWGGDWTTEKDYQHFSKVIE